MALTTSRKVEKLPDGNNVKKRGLAIEYSFLAGEHVMIGGDDGLIKPVSASVVPGTVGVGVIFTDQTVAAGGYVTYYSGLMPGSGSGFTGVDINKVAWMSDSTLGFFDTQGTNRIPFGRYRGVSDTYGTNNGLFEIGNVVSGTVGSTIY